MNLAKWFVMNGGKTTVLRANVELGEWVVMPNHFHAIVWIVDLGRGTARRAPTVVDDDPGVRRTPMMVNDDPAVDRPDAGGLEGTARSRSTPTIEQFGKPVAGSIPTILRAFKSAVTKRINIARGTPGALLWQRDYWEHVIRDQKSYDQIAEYIFHNPGTWREDQLWRD